MGEERKRFSKFDPCLPQDMLDALIVESSLDVPSARKVLNAPVPEATELPRPAG
jgi:hypothetical protein